MQYESSEGDSVNVSAEILCTQPPGKHVGEDCERAVACLAGVKHDVAEATEDGIPGRGGGTHCMSVQLSLENWLSSRAWCFHAPHA